jgi:hypothetical protein
MRKIIVISFLVLFLGSVLSAGYFFHKWRTLKNNPNAQVEDENKMLISKVGKLMLLPVDEQPTIATVTDPAKLADQAFFANAKVGYKVLVFGVAKKAILYDPENNLIIEVGPVNMTEESTDDGTTETVTPEPTIPTKKTETNKN